MKNTWRCFKGGSSNPESISRKRDGFDEQDPFSSNEILDNAWRNEIQKRDDRYPPVITFEWDEILEGTENLRITNFLGEGNFGEVYRCDFPRIDKVGVAKIPHLENAFAHSEFVAEITALEACHHPNVIKLLGKCSSAKHHAIVYQFMPKGSLDHHLYPHTRTDLGLQQEYPVLNWETRMKIAEGVADALVYLHDQRKLIHGDVNVSNVLLAEDNVPKLGDFGLATEIAEQQSKINPIKGTPGCIAPETEENGVISTKSDVYCYGVFLIMLFTGRKAYDRERSLQTRKIADWFIKLRGEEMIRCSKHKGQQKYRIMVDMALGNKFSEEGLERLFQAVRLCLEPDVSTRLNMTSVRAMVHEAATKRRSFEQAATSDSSVE